MTPIKDILIVGGGSSGWLAAAYLANQLNTQGGAFSITLIEASDIPTVGVGEATIPPILNMVDALGLKEADFLRATNGSFKTAIKFDDWLFDPTSDRAATGGHSYYHTFGRFGAMGADLTAPYWVLDDTKGDMSFVDYTMMEGRLCDAGVGPKRPGDKDFQGPLAYAYHFDAGKLATLLKDRAKDLGVKHLVGKVADVKLSADGSIEAIDTDDHGRLTADLYIDCTGFHARLIEGALGTNFNSLNDTLFCDRAVAIRVPHAEDDPIHPYTTATAQENGWIWDIPLYDRRGCGYVYSSRHTSDEEAEKTLRAYVGEAGDGIETWPIKIRCGYRDKQWHGNCVAIGLSAGFIEPLESTGIYLVDIALRWLADFMPPKEGMAVAADTFNNRMVATYTDIVDFVKLHYAISDRDDTAFWRENRDPASWPESLKAKLDAWAHRVPSRFEFAGLPQVFGLTNYMQVLYGMERAPDLSATAGRFTRMAEARQMKDRMVQGGQGGQQVLPKHKDLLTALYEGPKPASPPQPGPGQTPGIMPGMVPLTFKL